jgi:hypothetical protein
VGPAHQREVQDTVVATAGEGLLVVELEVVASGAAAPEPVPAGTAAPVALVHRPPDCGRDVARGGGGVGFGEIPPGRTGLGKPLRFDPLQLLGDGDVDDAGQIAVGHRGAHQGLQALELVAQLGAGGEADLVARGGEGLHDDGPGRRGHLGLEVDSAGLNSGRPELPRRDATRGETLGQLADARSDVGPGLQLADELPDLAVGHPGRPPEQRLRVLAVHLADVGDDVGLYPPRLPHELGQLTEKVLVSEALQTQHGDSLGEMSDRKKVYGGPLPHEVRLSERLGSRRHPPGCSIQRACCQPCGVDCAKRRSLRGWCRDAGRCLNSVGGGSVNTDPKQDTLGLVRTVGSSLDQLEEGDHEVV